MVNTILTDDERHQLILSVILTSPGTHEQVARAIEAAVLAKLREQEPVAYGMPDTQLGRKHRLMMVRLDKGQDGCTLPLYAAPLPAVVPEITDAMALAFHRALTDGDIGQSEVEDIKIGLKAALTAAPEAPAEHAGQVPKGRCVAPPCKCSAETRSACAYWNAAPEAPATAVVQVPQGWRELLERARDCIDTLPGYPKGADICDEIDAMLAAAPEAPNKEQR